ncbi:bifunctional diaminohydroxyphosphoribosylaminopyrimidine deaminase/5-amino-6-(5-phosphoribosylamino)uracil reductase RibD [Ktedonobacter racemifer]|uniref:Riboflavin biosynthesis protein RibD n=1 Tax=Ktedonobacter racemifer DSM 44963 TaxID=485913 RepID=D6U2S2_KTERA|nr:bifunctional diaminohydroxyphosphoribosylaminopyrimidine deaminase/5-amino-6-(5-phosphoribosylamino)uracil reductase RibD [Ktedonobacter racemifer]EFH81036.1 riboflavin biosynthesis protein RibD [Ktedonobacter racemifer DSM 44963]
MSHLEFMQKAIACARSIEGRTSPRPPVGAVLVRENQVIGRGATSPPYGPHAEIHALREAETTAAVGADLYTTLEPCCITVHTPPCTAAIIAAGIKRVIIGSLDPNPQVSGRGVAQLREAGIEVITTIAEPETAALIRPFATYITQGRPYVTAKWAMTLDGKLASHTGDASWISGSAARTWVHQLRDRVDAIMIGVGTAHADDPRLTIRLTEEQRVHPRTQRPNHLRIVVSSRGELNAQLQLFQKQLAPGTCVIVSETSAPDQRERLRERGIQVIEVPADQTGRVDLMAALHILGQREIMHLLLEGGSSLLGSAFEHKLIDHVAAFVAPKLIGGEGAPSPIGGAGLAIMQHAHRLQQVSFQTVAEDLLIEGEMSYTAEENNRGN